MKKICILSKNSRSYFIDRLTEEVGDCEVEVINPFISNFLPSSEYYIVRTTGVYHNDNDLKLLGTLPQGKVINPLDSLTIFRSKLTQFAWFEANHFLCLPYLNLRDTAPSDIEKFFQVHKDVVIKPNFGQGGWGVRIVNLEEAMVIFNSLDNSYLLQPYISDAYEVRYFFIKDRPPLIQRRIPTKGIAANFQNHGESELIELAINHHSKIKEVVFASGAQYGAIDCFIINQDIYFLELNTVPGIEQAEKASGRNLIRELLSSATFPWRFP